MKPTHLTKSHAALLALATGAALLTAACASTDDGQDTASTSSEVTGGGALETFNGVTAHVYGGICSPVYARSGTDVSYGGGGTLTDTCGFQCVELAVRYMHFKEGITGAWSVGTAIEMCGSHPAGVVTTASPVVGDLMVYKANDPFYGTGSAGHVAVIRGLNGDGTLNVFNQRWASEATAFTNGIRRDHAACFLHSVHGASGGGGGTSGGGTTPTPKSPTGCGKLTAGQGLTAGRSITSCDNRYSLVMQTDDNLVLYDRGHAIWAANTYGDGTSVAVMQGDGNFVAYGPHNDAHWSSRTNGHAGARLALQTDGNLVVYGTDNKPLWASNTNGK